MLLFLKLLFWFNMNWKWNLFVLKWHIIQELIVESQVKTTLNKFITFNSLSHQFVKFDAI